MAYEKPADPRAKWSYMLIDSSMHLTHNFDVVAEDGLENIYVGGKEGINVFSMTKGQWKRTSTPAVLREKSFGEVSVGRGAGEEKIIAGIEPMHGNTLALYHTSRMVLTEDLNQGHALAVADLLNTGTDQVVVGWRQPNGEKKVGIKLFTTTGSPEGRWADYWIDDNGMACEDLQVADIDGDGKKDIIAAGRATHNLKIYWNKSR
ncbi:MAG TPA: hypothetical protein VD816_04665 [Ohtaekwangia sp.]|nr:hypothetical protein [Ohtaekwangia sp.]